MNVEHFIGDRGPRVHPTRRRNGNRQHLEIACKKNVGIVRPVCNRTRRRHVTQGRQELHAISRAIESLRQRDDAAFFAVLRRGPAPEPGDGRVNASSRSMAVRLATAASFRS